MTADCIRAEQVVLLIQTTKGDFNMRELSILSLVYKISIHNLDFHPGSDMFRASFILIFKLLTKGDLNL